MRRSAIGIQLLLSFAFVGAAVSKLSGSQDVLRDRLGIAAWFWIAIALVEVLGAMGMLAGVRSPRVAVAASLGLTVLMVGAIVAHLRVTDTPAQMLPPVVLLLLTTPVVAIRMRELDLRAWRIACRPLSGTERDLLSDRRNGAT